MKDRDEGFMYDFMSDNYSPLTLLYKLKKAEREGANYIIAYDVGINTTFKSIEFYTQKPSFKFTPAVLAEILPIKEYLYRLYENLSIDNLVNLFKNEDMQFGRLVYGYSLDNQHIPINFEVAIVSDHSNEVLVYSAGNWLHRGKWVNDFYDYVDSLYTDLELKQFTEEEDEIIKKKTEEEHVKKVLENY